MNGYAVETPYDGICAAGLVITDKHAIPARPAEIYRHKRAGERNARIVLIKRLRKSCHDFCLLNCWFIGYVAAPFLPGLEEPTFLFSLFFRVLIVARPNIGCDF